MSLKSKILYLLMMSIPEYICCFTTSTIKQRKRFFAGIKCLESHSYLQQSFIFKFFSLLFSFSFSFIVIYIIIYPTKNLCIFGTLIASVFCSGAPYLIPDKHSFNANKVLI